MNKIIFRKIALSLLVFAVSLLPFSFTFVESPNRSVKVSFGIQEVQASVSVKGYFRKNGTYVQPHMRSSPDSNPYNNWSYPGNTNPYTGKVAPGNPDTYLKNYYNNSTGSGSTYTVPTTPYIPNTTCPSNSYYSTTKNSCLCNSGYAIFGNGNSCENGFLYCMGKYGVYSNFNSKTLACECDDGYVIYNDKCALVGSVCEARFGSNAEASGSTQCQCKYGYAWDETKTSCISNEPIVKEAFIKINTLSSVIKREKDRAYRIYGTTSDNCSKVTAEVADENGSVYDQYALSKYKYGDTNFAYGIREDWGNMKTGKNTYTFIADCDGGQEKQVSTTINFSAPTPPPSNYFNSGSGLSNDNSYINSDGNSIHSPAYSNTVPLGATAKCRDGTYSFSQHRSGTCSGHGGVEQWF